MSKKTRRTAKKLMLPLIALVMMTSMMAIAGSNHRVPAAASSAP